MLCDDLEGWDREVGREVQEGGDMGTSVCRWPICFVVQQKLTEYCEAIIVQCIKKKKKKKTSSGIRLPGLQPGIYHFSVSSVIK